ncbi:hypothetical protein CROQUDRAFT_677257, partial [Cronartium quercuum f. sp. fusiforme G11]
MGTNEGIYLKHDNVGELLGVIDQQGLMDHKQRQLKRHMYHVKGPNHIWASDGHDKLKSFGITIYGFIDAWSCQILNLKVGINNNDPQQIGVYFLETVAKVGGIPQRTSTDCGTETLDIAAHQINLSKHYLGLDLKDAEKQHKFTISPHNQKIECLWSQLM